MLTLEQFAPRLHALRERQAALHGRAYSTTDKIATSYLAEVAFRAMADIQSDNSHVNFRVVSMPTGYGKTTTAAAFLVAMAMADPEFAGVYVCKERELAEEVADMIDALAVSELGMSLATVYTAAHASKWDRVKDSARYLAEYGFVPKRPATTKADLRQARIIVVTHAAWLHEVEHKKDAGILTFNGKRRLAFVDEQPDLVRIIEVRPAVVQDFHDRVCAVENESNLAKRLTEIVTTMNGVMDSTGETYTVPPISTEDDILIFAPFVHAPSELMDYTTPGVTREEKQAEINRMARVCRFLVAAANAAAFYSRTDKSFWAYELAIQPGPGHVLLDATADLGPIVTFLPGVERTTTTAPSVNYANLRVVYVPLPKVFKNAKATLAKAQSAREYADWIKRVVTTVAPAGSRSLLIAHKSLFDHEYLPPAYDPDYPMDLEGRRVVVTHWGSGIGSNKYKDADYVFQFGEWHLPRGATVSQVNGYRGDVVSASQLKLAVGRRTADGDYQPRGDYRTASENHLLRWSKQTASRGSVRNIDGDGNCGSMTLVVTMDQRRLIQNLDRLYPGAGRPKTVVVNVGSDDAIPAKGRDGLIRLLTTTDKPLMTSQEVGQAVGLRPCDLKREFNSDRVRPVAEAYGWELGSRKRAGPKGKGIAVFRNGLDLTIENRTDLIQA